MASEQNLLLRALNDGGSVNIIGFLELGASLADSVFLLALSTGGLPIIAHIQC